MHVDCLSPLQHRDVNANSCFRVITISRYQIIIKRVFKDTIFKLDDEISPSRRSMCSDEQTLYQNVKWWIQKMSGKILSFCLKQVTVPSELNQEKSSICVSMIVLFESKV